MRICHFTNTFLPHVGGVARAVQTLLEDQRRARHRVLVVAPEFAEDQGKTPLRIERSVARTPALTHFNESDFSVGLPSVTALLDRLVDFHAELVHSHHPFLLGATALREGARRGVPVVFTHHTLYEQYTHYLPFDGDNLAELAIELATRYANRCAAAIAPSASLRDLMVKRGVTVPVHVIPTGIDVAALARGQRDRARTRWKLPADALVIGHLGRLAEEKNLPFLGEALMVALRRHPSAYALIVGDGPERARLATTFEQAGLADRIRLTGRLSGAPLRDAGSAMDLFAFSSHSETQGLVLVEAMAAGVPVVALDASGVREVVQDRTNGRLLPKDASAEALGGALAEALAQPAWRELWADGARRTAADFDRSVTSARLLELYTELVATHTRPPGKNALQDLLDPVLDGLMTEGKMLADKAGALFHVATEPADKSETDDDTDAAQKS